jgi:hypothetical protein
MRDEHPGDGCALARAVVWFGLLVAIPCCLTALGIARPQVLLDILLGAAFLIALLLVLLMAS